MGAWGVGIWENDTALDIKDGYEQKLSIGKSNNDALIETINEWKNDDWEDVIFALASLQLENNILLDQEVIEKAIAYSHEKSGADDYKNQKGREEVLESLYLRLQKFN